MYILADDDQRLDLILNNISKQKHIKFLNFLASGKKNTTVVPCQVMINVHLSTWMWSNSEPFMWKLVSLDVILNNVPWSFISVSPKLNFTGSQVVTLLKFMWPLGRASNKNGGKKWSQGPNPQNKTGVTVTSGFFKSSRPWIKGLVCVFHHLWQTWIKKNPSLQRCPDLRFSYKLRTFSRNPGKFWEVKG